MAGAFEGALGQLDHGLAADAVVGIETRAFVDCDRGLGAGNACSIEGMQLANGDREHEQLSAKSLFDHALDSFDRLLARIDRVAGIRIAASDDEQVLIAELAFCEHVADFANGEGALGVEHEGDRRAAGEVDVEQLLAAVDHCSHADCNQRDR